LLHDCQRHLNGDSPYCWRDGFALVSHSKPQKPDHREPRRLGQRSAFYFFHPVRRRGATKQRIWMGPGGYFCGCERRIANSDAYSYADGNGNGDADGNPNREPHCNSIGNGYAATPSIRSASSYTAA
jgi:hypothetical protein